MNLSAALQGSLACRRATCLRFMCTVVCQKISPWRSSFPGSGSKTIDFAYVGFVSDNCPSKVLRMPRSHVGEGASRSNVTLGLCLELESVALNLEGTHTEEVGSLYAATVQQAEKLINDFVTFVGSFARKATDVTSEMLQGNLELVVFPMNRLMHWIDTTLKKMRNLSSGSNSVLMN